jgi:hypothetical protein
MRTPSRHLSVATFPTHYVPHYTPLSGLALHQCLPSNSEPRSLADRTRHYELGTTASARCQDPAQPMSSRLLLHAVEIVSCPRHILRPLDYSVSHRMSGRALRNAYSCCGPRTCPGIGLHLCVRYMALSENDRPKLTTKKYPYDELAGRPLH